MWGLTGMWGRGPCREAMPVLVLVALTRRVRRDWGADGPFFCGIHERTGQRGFFRRRDRLRVVIRPLVGAHAHLASQSRNRLSVGQEWRP